VLKYNHFAADALQVTDRGDVNRFQESQLAVPFTPNNKVLDMFQIFVRRIVSAKVATKPAPVPTKSLNTLSRNVDLEDFEHGEYYTINRLITTKQADIALTQLAVGVRVDQTSIDLGSRAAFTPRSSVKKLVIDKRITGANLSASLNQSTRSQIMGVPAEAVERPKAELLMVLPPRPGELAKGLVA
jgi:hypothetical protein